jgi:hypothetical protein
MSAQVLAVLIIVTVITVITAIALVLLSLWNEHQRGKRFDEMDKKRDQITVGCQHISPDELSPWG